MRINLTHSITCEQITDKSLKIKGKPHFLATLRIIGHCTCTENLGQVVVLRNSIASIPASSIGIPQAASPR